MQSQGRIETEGAPRVLPKLTNHGRALPRAVALPVACPFSPDEQESQKRNNIERDDNYFVKPDHGINGHVEGFPRYGIPFAVHPINPVAGKSANHGRKNKQGAVYDRAPHEERSHCWNVHHEPPLFHFSVFYRFSNFISTVRMMLSNIPLWLSNVPYISLGKLFSSQECKFI